MIARLRGTLALKKPPFLLIDVNGVGYDVQAPLSTIYQLPDCGATVTLLTHLYIREDAQILYGFLEEKERALFRALIKVSGVGPKMALTILSGMDPSHFILCVEHKDTAPLIRLPGVGKKTAERLLIEMAGKLQNVYSGSETEPFSAKVWEKNHQPLEDNDSVRRDAISALIALGYKPQEAARAIHKIQLTRDSSPSDGNSAETSQHLTKASVTSQDLIKLALQGLAK